jgi:hypothetical protein
MGPTALFPSEGRRAADFDNDNKNNNYKNNESKDMRVSHLVGKKRQTDRHGRLIRCSSLTPDVKNTKNGRLRKIGE